MAKTAKETLGHNTREVQELFKCAFEEIRTASTEGDVVAGKFFPNGIELISITVKVATVAIEFKVAGPKAVTALEIPGDDGTTMVGGS